jgi:hypothetical protein
MKWYRVSSKPRKNPWTFYHGTESGPFEEFDPSKATKGKQHYNPLGNAMYVTDKPEFAKMFGKNVYPVELPPDAKVKTMTGRQAQSAVGDILKRALRKVGIDYWKDTDINFKVQFNREIDKAAHSPYDAIMESIEYVQAAYPDVAEGYANAVSELATMKFSKYDAVIFQGTNDPDYQTFGGKPTRETLIFNPAYQKARTPKSLQTP